MSLPKFPKSSKGYQPWQYKLVSHPTKGKIWQVYWDLCSCGEEKLIREPFCLKCKRFIRMTKRQFQTEETIVRALSRPAPSPYLPIGSKRVTIKGHIMVKLNNDTWVSEHTLVAEAAIGRKLKPGEVVHHINMDKTDNRPQNLLVCTDSYHRWLHYWYECWFTYLRFGGSLPRLKNKRSAIPAFVARSRQVRNGL